jgi:hypothetical protein
MCRYRTPHIPVFAHNRQSARFPCYSVATSVLPAWIIEMRNISSPQGDWTGWYVDCTIVLQRQISGRRTFAALEQFAWNVLDHINSAPDPIRDWVVIARSFAVPLAATRMMANVMRDEYIRGPVMKNLRLPVLFAVVIFSFAPVAVEAIGRVPKLVGLSRADAMAALTDKNPKRNNGALEKATTKNLDSPSASTLVRVPNVLGRLPDVAEDMLFANGLRMEAHGDVGHGIAACQLPTAGTEVKRGSVVIVDFEMAPTIPTEKKSCRGDLFRCRVRH